MLLKFPFRNTPFWMDQTTANNLFREGAIFLLLDIPENTEFGIDYTSWNVGPKFKGVKMIPPGIHFIYYNVTDKHGNVGIRNGFFHDFKHKVRIDYHIE